MPNVNNRPGARPVTTPTTTNTTPTPTTPAATNTTWGSNTTPANDGFTAAKTSPQLRSDPAFAQVAAGTATIDKGTKGDSVKKLQEALIKAGYELPRYGADGDFGNETITALKKFQADAGVPQSGKFDKATLDKIAPASTPSTPSTPTPSGPPQNYLLKDPALADVANGTVTLAQGAKGEAVTKLQEALQLAGYKLPKYGADGDFGGETIEAIKKLQTKAGINPPTGRVDQATLSALDVAATKGLKYPPFDKLFADGKLTSTIAVGYDEAGYHRSETREIVKGLVGDGGANKGQGYTELNPRTATADALKKAGIDPVDKDVRYFVKTFKHDGKDVQSVVKLITPDTPNAKQKFAADMANGEMVMYSGHGRYGSGPDFDDINSTAGNFRIGDPYEAGHVQLGDNDLARTNMTKDYQLMMFAGCTTFKYLDDLRAKPGKDSKNLDLMVSTDLLYWGNLGASNLEMLDSVTSGRSMNEMHSRVETLNAQPGKKSHWKADGIQDN